MPPFSFMHGPRKGSLHNISAGQFRKRERGRGMEPHLLPITQENELEFRDRLVTTENTLAPSLYLQSPLNRTYAEPMMILNGEKAVERSGDPNYRTAILELHGIRPVKGKARLLKRYLVAVFQTQVLVMYCSKRPQVWLAGGRPGKREPFRRVNLQENTREIRRVKNLSVRALYALGLDYGVVKIGLLPGRVTAVLDVNPGPNLNPEMERSFSAAVRQYSQRLPKMLANLDQVVLGADPEFIMRKPGGELVMASDYFPRFGRVGCDAIWHGEDRSAKPLVEIRPRPTPDPRELVIRIYKGMLQAARRVQDGRIQWLAGALPHPGFPLGGHIHFSGVFFNFKLLRALDHYLALPMVLTEDPKGVRRRPKYGYLGDFRSQFHGGFEYRTLPSWLVSPTLTKGVLSAAKLVTARYPLLKADYLDRYLVQKAYYQGDKDGLREIVRSLWDELRNVDGYQHYSRYLDPFYRMIDSGREWNEAKDIRPVWKLPPHRS